MNNVKAILLALLGAWLLIGTRFAQHHHLTAEELERDAERALEFERREWVAGEKFVEREWGIVEGAVEREARLGAEAAKRVLERFEAPEAKRLQERFEAPPPPVPTELTHDIWRRVGRPPIKLPDGPFVKENDALHGDVTTHRRENPDFRERVERTQDKTVEPGCDWRQCFDDRKKAKCLHFCREDARPSDEAPSTYVPDPGAIRKRWLANPTSLPKELCEPYTVQGARGVDTNKRLLDEAPIRASPFVERKGPRLFCVMYTTAESHATHVRAAVETWAPGCDGFVAFSTESDPSLNAVKIEHQGEEAYMNMWQKLRSIWSYVHEHYASEYDFFFAGGEDLYVLPQNLRDFLTGKDPSQPQLLGRRFRDYGRNLFNSGGAGYVLSRGALAAFAEHKDDAVCSPSLKTPTEDVQIAKCLKNTVGIEPEDTRDSEGRERFHPFAPGHMLTIKPPAQGQPRDWFYDYTKEWPPLPGAECCSSGSVSFHYLKKPAMVRHVHAVLYDC